VRVFISLLIAAALSGCAGIRTTATTAAATECFHENAAIEAQIGYCEAVRVGDTLYVSGTVGQGDMPKAIEQAYTGLRRTLEARGLKFDDVVKENVYATDLDAFIANKDVRKRFYGTHTPAATWVQVSRLYSPKFVVEVELVAVYPR
jgi:enamine deaminase RidA (YjgF/YER057c/UK114 family)